MAFRKFQDNSGIDIHTDVLLISMPFGPFYMPSIGLGLLSASLANSEIATQTRYLNLKFLGLIGESLYRSLTSHPTHDMTGEWLFSTALFGDDPAVTDAYCNEILLGQRPTKQDVHLTTKPYAKDYIEQIFRVRRAIPNFLDECVEDVLSQRPHIVGFTSVFEQHIASLALAKRIKERSPSTLIAFGGANCEGLMGRELVAQFPFVDVVVSGEGEQKFTNVAHHYLRTNTIPKMHDVFVQPKWETSSIPLAVASIPMDDMPWCNYDEFFQQAEEFGIDSKLLESVPFETSRGCWWGQKNHCTFCGLNGSSLTFRSKNDEKALKELLYLLNRYPGRSISVVDNILDLKYFKTFLPRLAELNMDIDMFFEVKSNLRKDQLRVMRKAGIRTIQPGIESLSTNVLKLMRKGVTGIQNIQLLKWCKELGIEVQWNILWGFPDETPIDYESSSNLIPLITHLNPPISIGQIRLDRFSPHFDDASQFGITGVRPYRSMQLIYYPLSNEAIHNISYYFDYDQNQLHETRSQHDVIEYTGPLVQNILEWRRESPTSDLFYIDRSHSLLVCDFRGIASPAAHIQVLTGLEREVLLACDGITSTTKIASQINVAEQDIEHVLDDLVARSLVINERSSYLSLVLATTTYRPSKRVEQRLARILEESRTLTA